MAEKIKNLAYYLNKLANYFKLDSEVESFDNIHKEIIKGISFKGTNLWILFFAIIIASVGLNVNSTAVIIGAMLISPLMGPINGMGYSIATYNGDLFKQSLKNFGYAVGISLLASTAYFAITPISTAHSELLARTSPSIYDVLIALFGGLAGIIAISSKNKGNVIPGVAIATALMPPLCTAGYGLATAHWEYFFGAIYLFLINSVFIALASVIISQILKFPIRKTVDESQKRKINRWISTVIVIMILPSIYFGYLLVVKERFNENANKYILNVSTYEGNYLLKSDINPSSKTITLVYGGLKLDDEQKSAIIEKANSFNLGKPTIHVQQGLSFSGLDDKNLEVLQLRDELNKLGLKIREKDDMIDSLSHVNLLGQNLLKEISAIYPEINSCVYADTYRFHDSLSTPVNTSVILFTTQKSAISSVNKQKIEHWVKSRLNKDSVLILYH
jgi:uncharacterized hydrophobic protein (TIGR00271 family)